MKTLTKALVGTVAAGAMAASAATPAFARDNGSSGIDTGDVIAGALIIGGIVAVAAAASSKDRNGYRYGNDYRYDRAGYRGNYGRGMDPRAAVQQCVRAAERDAGRASYGNADVTDVRSVKQTRRGYEVRGRIAVNTRGHAYRRGDSRYGRGWNGDYRGWNSRLSGYDSGSFRCKIEYGRIAKLSYSGIRGLR